MPNERHYSNELNLESVGINLPYNMQAEQSVLGAVLLKPETLKCMWKSEANEGLMDLHL